MSTAKEIMHRGAQCVSEHETLDAAARMMRELGVGALPICGDDDRLKGIVTDRDIVVKCLAEGGDPAVMTAGELAEGRPLVIRDDDDADQVLRVMEQHRVRRLPVIDHEDHRLIGIISEADVARNLPRDKVAEFVTSVYA
ncbi:CBS domain-containing protein [Streptacidiphilus sp. ASG 303]|uniref:CBS domain-containing protein n=1 Tax=Streptomycetaceae TaxID=2062 RepID=UPI001E2A4843|nr:CBS domain-containing protein [Streptacidiphilus sp. ASG 303]MCD0481758.1 CBS domain-containing protein [Streptacidiphilus sp. ASG 303]